MRIQPYGPGEMVAHPGSPGVRPHQPNLFNNTVRRAHRRPYPDDLPIRAIYGVFSPGCGGGVDSSMKPRGSVIKKGSYDMWRFKQINSCRARLK